jgi:hypothetical protein
MPRQNDRVSYLKEVELEFASGRRSARISDISAGGCYIDTIAQVPVGESLSLYISTDSGEAKEFTGKVAYLLEGFGFGVEFTGLTEDQRAFLAQILNSSGG